MAIPSSDKLDQSPKGAVIDLDFSAGTSIVANSFSDWCKKFANKQQAPMAMSRGEELLACMFLFVFPGVVVWLPVLFFVVLPLAMPTILWLLLCLGVIFVSMVVLPNRFYPPACGWYMPRLFSRYFSLRLLFFADATAYDSRQSLFVTMPHGVFPIGDMMMLRAFCALNERVPRTGVACAFIYAPVLRTIFTLHGAISASRQSLMTALNDGENLMINITGISGIYSERQPQPNVEVVDFGTHRGYIRLAIDYVGGKTERRLQLVPVYIFGQSACMKTPFANNRFVKWLSRKLRFPVCLPYGRWFLPIPWRTPITIAFGQPVTVAMGTSEQDLHTQLRKNVAELYDRARRYYYTNWSERQLQLL